MATTEDPRAKLDATAQWRREPYDAKPGGACELFPTVSGLENQALYRPDKGAIV